ncbi:MAG TPA: hypothetical protein VLQ66_00720, partial [Paenisporosarcina sp.]|nr:hypothetical protein [Paenisporosarcina sp.]
FGLLENRHYLCVDIRPKMEFRPLSANFILDRSLKCSGDTHFKGIINGGRCRHNVPQFVAAPDPVGVVL